MSLSTGNSLALCGKQLMHQRLHNSSLRVFTVPCLQDNYAWVLQDTCTGQLAVVDVPSAKPIIKLMREIGVKEALPPIILNTHHHRDHTGGNLEMKRELNATVIGPAKEDIVGIDRKVSHGDILRIGETACKVLDIPGHTRGHVGYVFEELGLVFVGDTLFSKGCGAVFEGSYEQMWSSLSIIMALPQHYIVFCAHEYTEMNLLFAKSVFPHNLEIQKEYEAICEMRKGGEQTVPSLIGYELQVNPFLLCRHPEIHRIFGKLNSVDTFEHLRKMKDAWRGGAGNRIIR